MPDDKAKLIEKIQYYDHLIEGHVRSEPKMTENELKSQEPDKLKEILKVRQTKLQMYIDADISDEDPGCQN